MKDAAPCQSMFMRQNFAWVTSHDDAYKFSRALCIRFYRKYQENTKTPFSDASWKSSENNVFQWFSSRYIRHGDLVSCDQSQANKRYTGTLNFIHSWWIWDFSYIFHADWLMRVLYHRLQFKLSLRREWDQSKQSNHDMMWRVLQIHFWIN